MKHTAKRNPELPVYIIDASIFIFRYFFSMPTNWQASNGRPTETVYGYTLWLLRFMEAQKPGYVVACFDESLTTCFRNEIYADYKISRALPDDDLAFQLLACKKVTELLGIQCFASERYEADDLIGCFAKYCSRRKLGYAILSKDKDLGQLLYDDLGQLWDYPGAEPLGETGLFNKMGVHPHQIADYLALVGDTSDDIPGAPGVGAKSAIALLQEFGDWKTIRSNIARIENLPIRGARSLQKKISENIELVDLSLKLSTIVTNAIKVTMKDIKKTEADLENFKALCMDLGFPQNLVQKIESKDYL